MNNNNQIVNFIRKFTFTNEIGIVGLFQGFQVDGFVFREVVKVQMFQQQLHLPGRQRFAQKVADFFNFSAEVLHFTVISQLIHIKFQTNFSSLLLSCPRRRGKERWGDLFWPIPPEDEGRTASNTLENE